jgi:hypothetical protein
MPASSASDTIIGEGIGPVQGAAFTVPTHHAVNVRDRASIDATFAANSIFPGADEIKAVPAVSISDSVDREKDDASDDIVIVTGADAAAHLLPMRDDGGDALAFRSILFATGLAAFQTVMTQICNVGVFC